jgi:septal ring factor EnvC (AmiA/AmiB activator)
MRKFLSENFKYIMTPILLILIGLLIYDLTSKDNGMSKEDKKRIEQLDKDINSMIEYQKQLDEKITEYNKEILKIDSTISNIKVKKEVVNNYYEQKSKEIKNSNAKQVDSLLRSRYNF